MEASQAIFSAQRATHGHTSEYTINEMQDNCFSTGRLEPQVRRYFIQALCGQEIVYLKDETAVILA